MRRCISFVGTLGILALMAACADDGGTNIPVEVPNVAGAWTGMFQLESGTFPASMMVSQDDRLVGGTIEIVQHLPPSEIIAAVDDFGNVAMLIKNGCEEWFGQLFVSNGDQTMEGTLQIDRNLCDDGIGEFGVLRVTK